MTTERRYDEGAAGCRDAGGRRYDEGSPVTGTEVRVREESPVSAKLGADG